MAATAARNAADLTPREQVRIYVLLLLASLAYNYNFVLIDYVRPFLIRQGGLKLAQTAWLYTAQGTGVLIGSVVAPVFVARFGSRAVLAGASLALAGLTASNHWTTNFPAWVVARFLVGLTLTGTYVTSITMLANLFPPRLRGRLLSINMAMFSVALLAIGSLGAALGEEGWRTLIMVGAAGPLLVALSTPFLPDDRRFVVFADAERADAANDERGSWREMLAGRRLRLTLACLLLAGLNFSGYQFYSGFITTYLINVRHFDAHLTGLFVTVDGLGTLAGSLLWGWVADRYGRKVNLIGFALIAVFIVTFLIAPVATPILVLVELGYAICLSCTNVWAAYFAELFPVRLRPMGASLFHGGHIISLFAPLIVTFVAARTSLGFGMALAPATFLAGALLWAALPETLKAGRWYRGFEPERGS